MTTIFTRQADISRSIRNETAARSGRAFSFSRLISSMTGEGSALDGYEREFMEEFSRNQRGFYDAQRMPIPLELLADPTIRPDMLSRDLSKVTASAGGYLVGASNAPIADLLRPWSVASQAGITVVPVGKNAGIAGDLVIPKANSGMTGYWLNTETNQITQSDPTIEKIVMKAKSGGALAKFSRLLARQGNVADAFLQREMLKTIGRLVDVAILAGSGSNGQPTGIPNTLGINTASGAFSGDSALAMEETAANEGSTDKHIGFLTTPAVRRLLKKRTIDASSTGKALWNSSRNGDEIAGRAGFVAEYVNASSMICGPWNDCVLAIWGTPTIEINPYDPSGFKAGTFEARLLIDCDVAIVHPGAWTVHSSIS